MNKEKRKTIKLYLKDISIKQQITVQTLIKWLTLEQINKIFHQIEPDLINPKPEINLFSETKK